MSFYNVLINKIFPAKKLSAVARRAGYQKDQMGIRSRYVRERSNWNEHLTRTRQFIVDAAQNARLHNSVAVLGSGWLLDVPIDELAAMFTDVYLIDIVHPEPVKERVRRLPNVHLLTADLTGGAVQLAVNADSFVQFVDYLQNIEIDNELANYDFVVSVNLLNQLDIILCDYLKERFGVGEEQLLPIRMCVQQRHINSMPHGKSCLVTDYQQIDTNVLDETVCVCDLLHCTLPNANNKQEWNWLFDTNQRYSARNNTAFKVLAVCF